MEETIKLLLGAWLPGGDFNCVRYQDEKLGGNLIAENKLASFNKFIETLALSDLKITGTNWTWVNR